MKLILTLAAVSATFSVNTLAQTERELDSHVHGSASLNVAISDSLVFIELNTPWNNIVGFEHAPQTDEQKTLVESALQHLNDPSQLFTFNAGNCTLDTVELEGALTGEHGDEDGHDDEHDDEHKDGHDDEHDDEHKDGHDDEHDDEHKDGHNDEHDDEHKDGHDDEHDDEHKDGHGDEHEDEHADHDGESETHSAVLAIYSYKCDQIDNLNTIDATLFSVWPGVEDLDVQLIGGKGQTLVELSPESTVIDIEQVR